MELAEILARLSEGLPAVDASTSFTTIGNRKKDRATGEMMPGTKFLQGVKTMKEPKFIQELADWWKGTYPNDFSPTNALLLEVPYPNLPSGNDCDLIFSSDGSPLDNPEWAIELKHISFCGDNGIKNDHGVQKMLSPYRKDRALIHDIKRLKESTLGKRKAVIGYCFDYSFETCEKALELHPNEKVRIENLKKTCKENDPENGILNIAPLVDFADAIFKNQGLVKSHLRKEFKNAWRHPCGGNGTFFAWEI